MQRPGAVSGTVWQDVGAASRLLDGGDRRLTGWLVEVVDVATGAIVGRATTDRNGAYRVGELLPGTPLAVRFREPGSSVVFGYPVNGETAPGSSGAPIASKARESNERTAARRLRSTCPDESRSDSRWASAIIHSTHRAGASSSREISSRGTPDSVLLEYHGAPSNVWPPRPTVAMPVSL